MAARSAWQSSTRAAKIRSTYRADFICGDIVVELKASSQLGPADVAQMWHYLAVTRKPVGLLLNFGHTPLQARRFVNGLVEPVSLETTEAASPGPAP